MRIFKILLLSLLLLSITITSVRAISGKEKQEKIQNRFNNLVKNSEKSKEECEKFHKKLMDYILANTSENKYLTNKTAQGVIDIIKTYPGQPEALKNAARDFWMYSYMYEDLNLAGFYHVYTCPIVYYKKSIEEISRANIKNVLTAKQKEEISRMLHSHVQKDLNQASAGFLTHIWVIILMDAVNGNLLKASDAIFVELVRVKSELDEFFLDVRNKSDNKNLFKDNLAPKNWDEYTRKQKKVSRDNLLDELEVVYKVNRKIMALLPRIK